MSLALLSQEIRHFLKTGTPEVLCITGRWGVGKTHAWAEGLKRTQTAGALPLKRYSYVSLFGQGTLDDVKNAIWENSVESGSIEAKPSFETIEASLKTAKDSWRRFAGFARFLPGVNEYAGLGSRALFLLVREQIVCVDDLERAGSSLSAKEVLGLLSFLKEHRACKVVLLLNEEALTGADAVDFKAQLEKVADTIVHLDPTPSEAAAIGVSGGNEASDVLRQNCIELGIVNIRTIKKIERHCARVAEIIGDLDQRVLAQAIQSLVLFAYCRYQPDQAPPLDFVSTFNIYEGLIGGHENDPHAEARALLQKYNFTGVDAFEAALLDGV